MFTLFPIHDSFVGRLRDRLADLNELISNYTPNPVLVIINANPTDDLGIPTDAYGMLPLQFPVVCELNALDLIAVVCICSCRE